MNEYLLRWINYRIYHQFPEVAGARPTIRRRPAPPGRALAMPTYQLTYRATVTTSNGHRLHRSVRVVVNGLGRILRITTSR